MSASQNATPAQNGRSRKCLDSEVKRALVIGGCTLVIAAVAGVVGWRDGLAEAQRANAEAQARSRAGEAHDMWVQMHPAINPTVEKVVEQMLTDSVPARYSSLSIVDMAPGLLRTTCVAGHADDSGYSDAGIDSDTANHVELKARLVGGRWHLDSTSVVSTMPPNDVRDRIHRCVVAIQAADVGADKNRALWSQAASAAK